MNQGLVASCHDCSDGGLGAALAEMSLAGGLGFHVELRKVPMSRDLKEEARTDKVLFSESNARFVVEVPPKSRRAFQVLFAGHPAAAVGQVREGAKLQVVDMKGKSVSWSLPAVEKAWTGGMKV